MNIRYIKGLFAAALLSGVVACGTDPYFEYNGETRVQFMYPEYTDYDGNVSVADSAVVSLFEVPFGQANTDIWVKVRLVGDLLKADKTYKVSVVAANSSAVEGTDFEVITPLQTFHATGHIDSIRLNIDMAHAKTALKKQIILKIEDGGDLNVGLVECQTFKVIYTALRPEPKDWVVVRHILGAYHYMKYEKYIELSGTASFGAQAVREFYAKKVKAYFTDNVIVDPVTGERVECIVN